MNWTYNNKEYTEIHDPLLVGFVYKITHLPSGKEYIGMKNFYSSRTKKLGKKAIAILPDKRMSKKVKTTCESNWRDYLSSSKTLQQLIKSDPHQFKKEIISFHYTKKSLSYSELRLLVLNDVLLSDKYYNDYIGVNKFFRRDFLK